MILGFKQLFPSGGPTWFREKILIGVKTEDIKMYAYNGKGIEVIPCSGESRPRTYRVWEHSINGFVRTENLTLYPKLHSIRPGNSWKSGMSIQMSYGVRTKKYEQFNKGIENLDKVHSVQLIEIKYGIQVDHFISVIVAVNGRILDEQERTILALNDGFDSLESFYKWFNKDFSGQIIHWTDLYY